MDSSKCYFLGFHASIHYNISIKFINLNISDELNESNCHYMWNDRLNEKIYNNTKTFKIILM